MKNLPLLKSLSKNNEWLQKWRKERENGKGEEWVKKRQYLGLYGICCLRFFSTILASKYDFSSSCTIWSLFNISLLLYICFSKFLHQTPNFIIYTHYCMTYKTQSFSIVELIIKHQSKKLKELPWTVEAISLFPPIWAAKIQ